ncbi:MAG: DUF3175 domain-containing protein, partial [Alphaproteobacteria bacterium]|nr:DUF3175 domain-containing protein [Alphaproteobacteria bacterium]
MCVACVQTRNEDIAGAYRQKRATQMAKRQTAKGKTGRKWSAEVTETSHAMNLEKDVFRQSSPKKIAQSLKHSAEASTHRKSSPFRSAMSMLNFYINRAGHNLPESRKATLERAKGELR